MKQVLRNKDKGNFFERYGRSFLHACNGIRYSITHEHNMIIILLALIVVVIGGFVYKINAYEWLFCILVSGSVMAAELINTAIEATVDLVTIEKQPLAKIAKDTASSATLILCIVALVGALIIFIPKF